MKIRQWLQEIGWPALKSAWQKRHREKSRERSKARIYQPNKDMRNPSHPFNMEQQAADDYNDRRAQESLYDHLQDSQRIHHGHDYYH